MFAKREANVIDLAQFKTSFYALLGIADWFYRGEVDAHHGIRWKYRQMINALVYQAIVD